MTIREGPNVQLTRFADQRERTIALRQLRSIILLVDADGQLIVEVVPKRVGVDYIERRIHFPHPLEHLIKCGDGEWTPEVRPLVMGDEQVWMTPRRSNLGSHPKDVAIDLVCKGLWNCQRPLLCLCYWLVGSRIMRVVLVPPYPDLGLVTKLELIDPKTEQLATPHTGKPRKTEKDGVAKLDTRISEWISRITFRGHGHKSLDHIRRRGATL